MNKRRWLRVLPLAALLITSGITTAGAASSGTRAAQASTSMFARDDVYCTPSRPLPGRKASSPGVGVNAITITDMSIDSAGLARLGISQPEYEKFFTVFANEINKCGGINGRKINLKKAVYNPAAPDLAGHIQALCLKATEDHKAFVVVGVGTPQGTALQRCISVSHKTMYNGPVNMPSVDYADAKGRLFSVNSAADKSAAAVISDMIGQSVFRGRKVGIIGSATSPTAAAEQRVQYEDYLEKKNIDVESFEILPCQGNVCVQGIGPAIRRMKDKGVNLMIMTAYVSVTTVGSIFREMANQNLRAPVYGPHTGSLHADSVQQTLVRTTGNDGARFVSNNGFYAFNTLDVQGAWRTGQAGPSKIALTCNSIVAKALKQNLYEFGERDINTSRWTGPPSACVQLREIARAIESLGANVTTERMVAAIKTQKAIDDTYTYRGVPEFSARKWYSDRSVTPTKGVMLKFNFPCPLPTVQSANACFLPVDRPARVRTIKY